MTPQEAAETALTSAAKGVKIEGVPVVDTVVRAIELYESRRKRVQLTPEQVKAFEERVEAVRVEFKGQGEWLIDPLNRSAETVEEFRQLAAVLELLATNLERFPS